MNNYNIKRFIVINQLNYDSSFVIIEIYKIKPVYYYNLRTETFSDILTDDVELVGIRKFKKYMIGDINYMNIEINVNLNKVSNFIIYQSNNFEDCLEHIEMLTNTNKYNL